MLLCLDIYHCVVNLTRDTLSDNSPSPAILIPPRSYLGNKDLFFCVNVQHLYITWHLYSH